MFAVLLVLGIVGGAIAYRMVNAIVDAEQAAVVPLPTRSINFGGISVATVTPQTVATGVGETADPTGTADTGVTATTANVSVPTATAAALAPTVTSPAQSGPAPTATLRPYRVPDRRRSLAF